MYRQERMKYGHELNGLNESNGRKERSGLLSTNNFAKYFAQKKEADTLTTI